MHWYGPLPPCQHSIEGRCMPKCQAGDQYVLDCSDCKYWSERKYSILTRSCSKHDGLCKLLGLGLKQETTLTAPKTRGAQRSQHIRISNTKRCCIVLCHSRVQMPISLTTQSTHPSVHRGGWSGPLLALVLLQTRFIATFPLASWTSDALGGC